MFGFGPKKRDKSNVTAIPGEVPRDVADYVDPEEVSFDDWVNSLQGDDDDNA